MGRKALFLVRKACKVEALAAIFTLLLGAVTGFFKTFKFVKEGELGCILRFGKLHRQVEPGFIILIPFVEELITIHVRQTTKQLPKQTITLKDNYILDVGAVIVYRVTDPEKALFNIHSIGQSVKDIALTVLRHQFAEVTYSAVSSNFEELNKKLLAELKSLTSDWGVEFLHFRMSDFDPTPATAELILMVEHAKKQTEAKEILLNGLMKHFGEKGTEKVPPVVVAGWMGGAMPTVETGREPAEMVVKVAPSQNKNTPSSN